MNILGMGPLELLVILALALIVFGPEKLPEIGAQIGRMVRDFRRTTSDLSNEFHRGLQLELEERHEATRPAANGSATTTDDSAPSPIGSLPPPSPQPPGQPAPSQKDDADLQPPY